MGRRSLGQPRKKIAIAIAAGLCAWGAPAALALVPAFPTVACGHFFRTGQDFIIYNGGGLSCPTATKLIKEFASEKGTQHGTSDADSYWTLPGEPGFKCIQSMGQGECYKGSEIAGYKIKARAENVIYSVRL